MLEESSVWTSQTSLWNHRQSPKCLFQPACSMPCSCTPFQSHVACVSPGTKFHSRTPWSMQLLAQQGSERGANLSPSPILAMFPLFLSYIPNLDGMKKIAHLSLELKSLGNKGHPENNRMRLRRRKRSEDAVQRRNIKQGRLPACGCDEF